MHAITICSPDRMKSATVRVTKYFAPKPFSSCAFAPSRFASKIEHGHFAPKTLVVPPPLPPPSPPFHIKYKFSMVLILFLSFNKKSLITLINNIAVFQDDFNHEKNNNNNTFLLTTQKIIIGVRFFLFFLSLPFNLTL